MTIPFSRTQLIIDWITSLGWNTAQEAGYPLIPGPWYAGLDEPDRCVFITETTGPGFVVEEGYPQAAGFQTRLRGPSGDPIEPDAKARDLDNLILNAPFPVQVDGYTINHAHRLGGPPTPLPVDPNDLRHEFTATYLLISGV